MKNSKRTILFWGLVFSFMYLVSLDANDRSYNSKIVMKTIWKKKSHCASRKSASPYQSPNPDRKFPTRKAPAPAPNSNTGYANVKWLTSGFKPHKENVLLIAIKNNKLTICRDEKSYQVTLMIDLLVIILQQPPSSLRAA